MYITEQPFNTDNITMYYVNTVIKHDNEKYTSLYECVITPQSY